MSKDFVNDSELLKYLVENFGDDISVEGAVVTPKSSRCIGSGEEQFGFFLSNHSCYSISEACKLFYEGKGYEAVLRGKSVHLKKNRQVERVVVITESLRSNRLHVEMSILLI